MPVLLIQKRVYKIQHILSIHAKYATGACTIAIDAIGRDTRHNIAGAQKVRTIGFTQAGAAGIGIVRQ